MDSKPENTNSTPENGEPETIVAVYGERAIRMMTEHGVVPSPKHYSVFYAYAAGQPTGMQEEINNAIAHNDPLTEEFLEHLYNVYIAHSSSRAVTDSAQGARKIIDTVIKDIEGFSGETIEAGREIGNQLERLNSIEAVERDIRAVAEAVMRGAQAMQQSSNSVNQQLESAQREISSLRNNLAKVTTESERDFLTGSYNRKAFDKLLAEAAETAKLEGGELTIIMLDIDHFKKFNDTFGHLIGDEVLKYVAKTLVDTVKGMDLVARFGGEEFAIVLPNTGIKGGLVVGEAIRKNIASKELKRKSTGEPYGHVTASLGVATFRGGSDTPYHLIKRADVALYKSKKDGRNRVSQEADE